MSSSVNKNSCIRIEYSLKLVDGTEVENNGQSLFDFCMGDGSMISAFEDAILGMKPGEFRQVQLSPRETFGYVDESNYHWLEKQKFQHLNKQNQPLIEGLIIEFDTPAGDTVPGVVLQIEEQRILIDFNHPLAGQDLNFSVTLIKILS